MMKRAAALITMILTCLALNTYAAAPPANPILKIETGMHTAGINRIATDDHNRFLVTGSDDKTVRVWNMQDGRLLSVLRPPSDTAKDGKIYAVAMSPDGNTIACGGRTKASADKYSIYLFNRRTGALTHRVSGLPNVINHLAFSRDGQYLAVALGKGGIRVFHTSDYRQTGLDMDYDRASYWLDFDARNRLATSCLDGYIRLYQSITRPNMTPAKKKRVTGGKLPYAVSFSPEGTRIAVGFNDSSKVQVLSSKDLSLLYAPDTSSIKNGNFSNVAWSADGHFLFAGGSYYNGDQTLIVCWSDAGKGGLEALSGPSNRISHIIGLANGSIAYGASDPAFGIISSSREHEESKAEIADNRKLLQGLRVSRHGRTVRFGYEYGGREPAVFNIDHLQLSQDSKVNSADLSPPNFHSLSVTRWENTRSPKINGKPLQLKPYETSRSLAVAPDKSGFLLGTSWYLHYFDKVGHEQWNAPAPGTTWAVNITADGRLAVAAFGDGTIRWFRLRDGKELLALFPHKPPEKANNDTVRNKPWVLWTPSGYYAASAGADELIGWHLNNGADQAADFFPVSKFKSRFYRPDVVAGILDTMDEALALKKANEVAGRRQKPDIDIRETLPPVITIELPQNDTTVSDGEITITYSLRTPTAAPVYRIWAVIDGIKKRSIVRKKKKIPTGTGTFEVQIPEKDCQVSLFAQNRNAASSPATITLKWKGKAAQTESDILKPRLYVLSIGVSNYQNPDLKLDFPAKDAVDFVNVIKEQRGRIYKDVVVKLLQDATMVDVLEGLDWIQQETTNKDVAMMFLAGHGVNDRSGKYYFLPGNANPDKIKSTCVAYSIITDTVAALPGKRLCFLDTCHSGNIMGNSKRRGTMVDTNGIINDLSSDENGAVVFASSTGRQFSLENPAWGNGAFTKALVEGLGGKADLLGKGKITISTLDAYICERVKELTGGRQTPASVKPSVIPDFPIAVSLSF